MSEFEPSGEVFSETARILGTYEIEGGLKPQERFLRQYETHLIAVDAPLAATTDDQTVLVAVLSLPSGLDFLEEGRQILRYEYKYALTHSQAHPMFKVACFAIAAYDASTESIGQSLTINPQYHQVDIAKRGLTMEAADENGLNVSRRRFSWSHGSFTDAFRKARESAFVSRDRHLTIDLGPDKVAITNQSLYGARVLSSPY